HQAIAQEAQWIFMRYADVLLNYAEASIELKEYGDARNALDKIRERAGMPDIPSTLNGEQMLDVCRNERRVKLAFEQSRFYDVRRWMIAPEVMDENAKGINITVKGDNRADRSTYHDYK